MTDRVYEYMIRKNSGTKKAILTVLTVFAALLLTAVMILLIFSGVNFYGMGLFIIFLIWFGGVWLIKNFNVEYEYTIINHELDIDVIKGKSRRKHITTVNLKNAEFFDEADSPAIADFLRVTPSKKYYYVSDRKSKNICVTDVISRKTGLKVRVYIEPDEKLKEYIHLANPKLFNKRRS